MDFTGGITFTGGMSVTRQPPPSSKAIFGYGVTTVAVSMTNLVTTTGVGTARYSLAAASYGTDKAIFAYAGPYSNLVSNTGVVATDTTILGTARSELAAASYGYA